MLTQASSTALLDQDWRPLPSLDAGSAVYASYFNYVRPEQVQSLRALIESLARFGFSRFDDRILGERIYPNDRVRVGRLHYMKDGHETIGFSIKQDIELVNDDPACPVAVIVSVSGNGNSLELALCDAVAVVTEIEHRGLAVPMGRGQAKACRQIADQVSNHHRCEHIGPDVIVLVPYLTRGSRAERMCNLHKIAYRKFCAKDFIVPTVELVPCATDASQAEQAAAIKSIVSVFNSNTEIGK